MFYKWILWEFCFWIFFVREWSSKRWFQFTNCLHVSLWISLFLREMISIVFEYQSSNESVFKEIKLRKLFDYLELNIIAVENIFIFKNDLLRNNKHMFLGINYRVSIRYLHNRNTFSTAFDLKSTTGKYLCNSRAIAGKYLTISDSIKILIIFHEYYELYSFI